jgi:hypothetical protein
MAKVTLLFAVLLIALGLAGFFGTGSQFPTALIPTWIGLALGIGGVLAISHDEGRRKLFMHINVTIGLIGFLGGAIKALVGFARVYDSGLRLGQIALASQLTLAGLMFIYIALCVRSFIAARRSGKV